MCSTRCEIPRRSRLSTDEPTSAQMPTVAERTAGIDSVSTRRPLGSVVFCTLTPAASSKAVRAHSGSQKTPSLGRRQPRPQRRGALAAARGEAEDRSRRRLGQIAAHDHAFADVDRHARPNVDLLGRRARPANARSTRSTTSSTNSPRVIGRWNFTPQMRMPTMKMIAECIGRDLADFRRPSRREDRTRRCAPRRRGDCPPRAPSRRVARRSARTRARPRSRRRLRTPRPSQSSKIAQNTLSLSPARRTRRTRRIGAFEVAEHARRRAVFGLHVRLAFRTLAPRNVDHPGAAPAEIAEIRLRSVVADRVVFQKRLSPGA